MRTLTRTLLAVGFLTFFLAAFASPSGERNDGRRPVKLSETTALLGAQVPAGTYDLRWTREPGTETVKLEVTRGKRIYASGKGSWTRAETPFPHEALVYRTTTGASELSEIRFRGSAELIKVEPRSPGAVATSDPASPSDVQR